jgi:hypothetical protein
MTLFSRLQWRRQLKVVAVTNRIIARAYILMAREVIIRTRLLTDELKESQGRAAI